MCGSLGKPPHSTLAGAIGALRQDLGGVAAARTPGEVALALDPVEYQEAVPFAAEGHTRAVSDRPIRLFLSHSSQSPAARNRLRRLVQALKREPDAVEVLV